MDLDKQIQLFFKTHPCIAKACIAKELGLPERTFLSKKIPERYMWDVMNLLHKYGFNPIIPSTYGKENKLLL